MSEPWFSLYDLSFDYKGNEPAFTEPSEFAWAEEFAANASEIKKELGQYIAHHNLKGYFSTSMVSRKDSWKTIALKTWSVELFKNQKQFPFTTSLLKKYPQIISASFNLLEAKSRILEHCGDTNAIHRCHLGLEIPAGIPECGFKVKGESRSWENGKWLIFNDAYVHEAWNDTDKERYIFLIDVMRDEYAPMKGKIVSTVLTSLFLQKRAQNFKVLLTERPALIKGLSAILKPLARCSVFIVNTLKIY